MILGPVLFNIFFNDIFNFVEESILYNYADNNTLSYSESGVKTPKINQSINHIFEI
jgi:hypothetical protein